MRIGQLNSRQFANDNESNDCPAAANEIFHKKLFCLGSFYSISEFICDSRQLANNDEGCESNDCPKQLTLYAAKQNNLSF